MTKKIRISNIGSDALIGDEELVFNFAATEASSDWLRYGRLRVQNTAKSNQEADEMDRSQNVIVLKEE